MKHIIRLEKKIDAKMNAIKEGSLEPKESGIGAPFKMLKPLDEVSYEERIVNYPPTA